MKFHNLILIWIILSVSNSIHTESVALQTHVDSHLLSNNSIKTKNDFKSNLGQMKLSAYLTATQFYYFQAITPGLRMEI
jgi:hypothetical protein